MVISVDTLSLEHLTENFGILCTKNPFLFYGVVDHAQHAIHLYHPLVGRNGRLCRTVHICTGVGWA
jgi:hypothetical protein